MSITRILDWEVGFDTDELQRVNIGVNGDVTLGFSRIDLQDINVLPPITGIDLNGKQVFSITTYDVIDPKDFCVITGKIIRPFGSKADIQRIDLFDESLENSKDIFTNSKGGFLFIGVKGQKIKVKKAKENIFTFFEVPDKTEIKFEDIDGLYGFTIPSRD